MKAFFYYYPGVITLSLPLFLALVVLLLLPVLGVAVYFRRRLGEIVPSPRVEPFPGGKMVQSEPLADKQQDNVSSNFYSAYERITEPFIAIDSGWNYSYVNRKAAEIIQKDARDLVGKNVWEVFPEAIGGEIYNAYHSAMLTREYSVVELYYPAFGRWVENHLYPSAEGLSIFFRDITIQKNAAENALNANRLYQFLSECNKMMLRSESEEELYTKICEIAINTGNFRMAWVGLINPETQEVEPVVFGGLDEGYLDNTNIRLDGSTPQSHGTVITAIRNKHYSFSNDVETDPSLAQWTTLALKHAFHSVMSLPIMKGGHVIGAFTMYADKKNFFDEPEIRLLDEAGANLSFALDLLEKEKWRKQSVDAILESERRYETLTKISPVGIFHTNTEGHTTYVNPYWCRISGMSAEDAVRNGWMSAVHADDRPGLVAGWEEANRDEHLSFSEYRFIRPDGAVIWVIGQAIPEKDDTGKTVGYVGTMTDITDRKNAEIALERTTEKYRKAQVMGKMGHWELDINTNQLVWSDEIFSIFHRPLDTASTRYDTFLNAIHPEDLEAFRDMLAKVISGNGKLDYTHRIIDTEGRVSYVQEQGELVVGESGQPLLTGTARDVTEIIKARNEIIKEKNVSDSIINALPGIFYLFTRDGKYLRWNDNLESITGYTSEEIRGMHPSSFLHPREWDTVGLAITDTFNTGESRVEGLLVRKDKTTVPYYYSGLTLIYEGQLCIMCVGIDISERVLAKQKLRETSQQLRELTSHLVKVREEERKRIGREIHDELAQKLTAIKMDVAWLNKKLPGDDVVFRDKFKSILTMLDDANHSIRRILSELRPVIFDNYGLLEALVWQTQQFMATTGIPVKIETLESELVIPENIAISIFRICQEAFTNIARYAEASNVVISIGLSGNDLLCSIEDDGIGFDPVILQEKKSFGILGMKERIGSLNGTFNLITSVSCGTRLEISIPLAGQN